MATLFINNWQGEETDWITVTPQNPAETDSSAFDEGIATGFSVPKERTERFISDMTRVLRKYNIPFEVC